MDCATCRHPNKDGARFCSECGAPLTPACPGCGLAVGAGERFCTQCGSALGAGRPTSSPALEAMSVPRGAPPESERKQVTVLFADVARSMELAERLGTDEWTQVMQGLFAVCREAVEAYGGVVDKFTGDGVMALFGAPIALEDHARRACHAALRLVAGVADYAMTLRQNNVELAVRVGLNSGEVVAGSVGGDAVGGAYTAVGHTVGLAQRMESLAELGAVRLTGQTAALVGGEFRLRDLGELAVKGSSLSVRVFALDGVSGGSAEPGRRRSGSARLVGRDEELAGLEASLRRAIEGRAELVGIVGEAGAGKSRLCDELTHRALHLGVTVRRVAGVSHAQTVPLLPILGFLRDFFTVADADGPAEVREKVSSRLMGLDASFEADLGLIFDFLEVPDPTRPSSQLGPEALRRRILDVFSRITARRSERETLLLILEDLQWFDMHSVAFLDAWLPLFPGSRTLVVMNFRPEFHAPWMAHSYYRQLPLAPLDDAAAGELLDALLGPHPSVGSLGEQLRARTGGNPFFAEEIVRALAGDGSLEGIPGAYVLTRPVGEVRVPANVQAVLADRIDRLAGRDKAVLHAASVIGRAFTREVLGVVAGLQGDDLAAALRALCAGELLQVGHVDGEYQFWHPLTQEVAYDTLLAAVRRRLHYAVAQTLADSAPDRHEQLAALVAAHFEAADHGLEAARWQVLAASHAIRASFAEAQRRLRLAIDHLATVPESEETLALGVRARTLLLRLGGRTGMDKVEADRLFAEARPAAERLGDPVVLARLTLADAVIRFWSGDPVGAAASWNEAFCLADQDDQRDLRALCTMGIGMALTCTGPLAQGSRSLQDSFDLCAGDSNLGVAHFGFSLHDAIHLMRAQVQLLAGDLTAARRLAQAAQGLFEQRPMVEWRSWTLSLFAHLADCSGEVGAAHDADDRAAVALRLARDTANIGAEVRALQATGVVALLAGRPVDAAASLTEALTLARKHRTGLTEEGGLLAHLARAHLAGGHREDARAAVDEAVAVARRQGARVVECLAHVVRARVFRETATNDADLDAARAALVAGETLAAEIGAGTYAAFLAEERELLDGTRIALSSVADGYDAIGAAGHARRVRADLAARSLRGETP